MSVIGTTLKQPRVFAHDAVSLCELPGCIWRGVGNTKIEAGKAGSGFTTGVYDAWLSRPFTTSNAGIGAQIQVDVVTDEGAIEEWQIPQPCGHGNAYNEGDQITINPPTKYHSTGIVDASTGYGIGGPFETSGGTGIGMTVQVDAVGGAGEVTAITIINEGEGYSQGDVLTILDGLNDNATFGVGVSTPAVFNIESLKWSRWNYGCPFTSFYMGLQSIIINDVTDARNGEPLYGRITCDKEEVPAGGEVYLGEPNVNGEVGPIQTQQAFMQKTKYTYTCDCEPNPEEPEENYCTCTYDTPGPGAALYIGLDLDELTVMMESGTKTTYTNIPAGTFMPISCLTICDVASTETPDGEPGPDKDKIIEASLITVLF